ncbi:MAG: hypothetical protein AAF211_23050 [Myxococcota bacterium]
MTSTPSWAVLAAYLRCRSTAADRAEVVHRQQVRLGQLLAYVGRRSPYWRSVLPLSVRRTGCRASAPPGLLAELPVVHVGDEVASFDDVNTAGLRRREVEAVVRGARPDQREVPMGAYAVRVGAGGLLVSDARERALHIGALLARVLPSSLMGAGSDRVALLARLPVTLPRAVDWAPRRVQCTGLSLGEPVPVQLARLRALGPTVLVGSPRRLRPVAERWAAEGGAPLVRVVSVAAEACAHDAEVATAFGVRHLHRLYRADEGLYGHTCAEGRLHLDEDLVIVERAWIDRQAGTYRPIVTDLFRTVVPRIRTRLDDVLTESTEPCPCGSPLRVVERVERVDATAAGPA